MFFEAAIEKAAQYAAAWSSNNPEEVARHYAQNGSATLNAGAPIQGRDAIAAYYATPFFRDFPGATVLLHDFRLSGHHGLFTGMLVAPPDRGKPPVHLLGWEEWTLDEDGLILSSLVWFDREEHARQIR